MKKEKEAIMAVLQTHGLKQANLTSEFAREQIADDIMEAQREIWIYSRGYDVRTCPPLDQSADFHARSPPLLFT